MPPTSKDMNARRNEVLTPAKRKEIATKAAKARWKDANAKKAAKKGVKKAVKAKKGAAK